MELKLYSIKYHKKEKKDYTDEWWILKFHCGDDEVTKRIEDEEFSEEDWHLGAKYNLKGIEPESIVKGSVRISKVDGKKQTQINYS